MNAGIYTIVPEGLTSNNYNITFEADSLLIDPADLTITALDQTKTEGWAFSFDGTEFSTSAMVGAESIASVSLSSDGASAAASAGTYDIIASSAVAGEETLLGNYTISYVSGTLEVREVPAIVYVDDDWTGSAYDDVIGDPESGLIFGYNAFATVQDGINAVGVGGDVIVNIGVYKENISIEKSLGLIAGGTSVLDGENTGTVITITADDVLVDGFIIAHSGPGAAAGIAVFAADGAVIRNNDIMGNSIGVALVDGSSNATIEDNDFTHSAQGIVIDYLTDSESVSSNNLIRGNSIALDGGNEGIYLGETATQTTIQGNNIEVSRYAIELYHSDSNVIENNELEGGLRTIRIGGSHDTVITGNHFLGNGPEGVVTATSAGRHSSGTVLRNNDFSADLTTAVHASGDVANAIDARRNHWGDISGPFETTLNPNGTGSAVSTNVLFDPWFATGDMDNLVLVLGDFAVADKTYDGTTDIDAADVSFTDNRTDGDGIEFTFSAAYPAAAAGLYTVDILDIGIASQDVGNTDSYVLLTTEGAADSSITTRVLNVTFSGVDRDYDGTTDATVTTSDDHTPGDDVTVLWTASFSDKNVGSDKAISVAGVSLTGDDAANYTVDSTGSATATISPRELDILFVGLNKEYDGDTIASVSSWDDRFIGDGLVIHSSASFDNKNVGTGKTVTIVGVSLSGTDADNYAPAFNSTAFADITARTLNITFTGVDKVYDGDATATVESSDDRLDGDSIIVERSASFADKNVGAGKTVTVVGVSLSGLDAGNYEIDFNGTTSAGITPRTLNVTYTGIDRVYDGSTDATVSTSDDRVGGDDLVINRTATFNDKHVGTNKTVNVSAVALSGSDAGNYDVASTGSASADITARSLTVAFAGVDRVYDATTDAEVTVVSDDRVLDDVFTIERTASFDNKVVGSGKLVSITDVSLTGADAANYTVGFNATTTASISAAELSVSGAVADNKMYDESTDATISGASLVGVLGSDDVSLVEPVVGTFASSAVGPSISVTPSLQVIGADVGNYTFTQPAGLSADILPNILGSFTVTGIASPHNAGVATSPVVTAYDIFGNVKHDYVGTVSFSSSDTQATLPANYTFTPANGGSRTFTGGVVLKTNAIHWVRVSDTDTAEDGEQAGIVVNPANPDHLTIAGNDTQIAGESQEITVSARDAFGNLVPGYDGTRFVVFSGASPSTNPVVQPWVGPVYDQAVFGAQTLILFENGQFTIDMTLYKAEIAMIHAQSTISGIGTGITSTGRELEIEVLPADPTRILWVDQPASTVAVGEVWEPISLEVTDDWGNRTLDEASVSIVVSEGAFAAGTVSQDAIDGLVTFDDLVYGATGTLQLVAEGEGLADSGASAVVTVGLGQLIIDGSLSAAHKIYDGTREATIDTSLASIFGLAPGADVYLNTEGEFASAGVGSDIDVSVSLAGADAGHYTFAQPEGLTANITARPLTIGGSFTAFDKDNDGTTAANIDQNNLSLINTVDEDDVFLGSVSVAFVSADSGPGQTVQIIDASLNGVDSDNYSLSLAGAPTALAEIVAPPTALESFFAGVFTADELADPSISGPHADADGDGWSNLFEFLFGFSPKETNIEDPISSQVVDGFTSWSFIRRADTSGLVVSYQVSGSPLNGFTQVPAENIFVTPIPGNPDYVWVTYTDVAEVSVGNPRYAKIVLSIED